ncbi:acyl-CoA dehydrogenase family protein [Rhodococcus koreensis]
MDFQFTDKEDETRLRFRSWLEDNLPEGWGTPEFSIPEPFTTEEEFLIDWQRKMFEGGWAGIAWPKKYGGVALTPIEQAIYWEERERYEAPRELNDVGLQFIGAMLMAEGTEEQRNRYLQPMLDSTEVWAQGFSEPDAGSDLASLRTRAVRDGDDYIVNGSKIWTSNGDAADFILLLVRTDPDAPKHKGISALIVDAHTPGIKAEPIQQIDGRQEFSTVFYDNVRVPVSNLIGAENDGWRVAMTTLEAERMASTYAFALRRRIAKLLIDFRGKFAGAAAASAQNVTAWQKLAEYVVEAHAARTTYYRGVSRLQNENVYGVEWSAGKLHTSEMAKATMGFGSGLFGMDGLVGGSDRHHGQQPIPWGTEYLHAFCRTIGAGTSQIQRDIIARRILGLPRG